MTQHYQSWRLSAVVGCGKSLRIRAVGTTPVGVGGSLISEVLFRMLRSEAFRLSCNRSRAMNDSTRGDFPASSTHAGRHAAAQARTPNPGLVRARCSALGGLFTPTTGHCHGRGSAQLSTALVDRGTSPITLNATITGLKFFFDVTLDRAELMAKMKPVFVPRTLPVVISREEVSSLIAATKNLKHQTALSVAYGASLRANELWRGSRSVTLIARA